MHKTSQGSVLIIQAKNIRNRALWFSTRTISKRSRFIQLKGKWNPVVLYENDLKEITFPLGYKSQRMRNIDTFTYIFPYRFVITVGLRHKSVQAPMSMMNVFDPEPMSSALVPGDISRVDRSAGVRMAQ